MTASQKGFSLIETILYVVIMAVILTTIALFLLNLLNARAKTRAISEVLAGAYLVEQRLSEAVRHAQAIRTNESVFGSDPGVLSLEMVDAGRNPTVFSLTANDGQFQVAEAGGAASVVTPDSINVSNLVFTNLTGPDDVGIVQVQFTIQTLAGAGSQAFIYDQAFQTTLRIPLD